MDGKMSTLPYRGRGDPEQFREPAGQQLSDRLVFAADGHISLLRLGIVTATVRPLRQVAPY